MFTFHDALGTVAPVPTTPVVEDRETMADPTDLHLVLGTPLGLEPGDGQEVIHIAAGCFWGVEKILWSTPGVVATATGYMGGHAPHPTYAQVCTSTTGHAETVRVVVDTTRLSIAELVALVLEIHDPTQVDGQGGDIGPQYRSAIWTTTPEQREIAAATCAAYEEVLRERGFGAVTTEVADASEAGPFWYAERYHQGYLHTHPDGYQCHARTGIACPVLGH